MPDIFDCLAAAVADGHLSREAAGEYRQRLDELGQDAGQREGKSWYESRARIAERLQAEIERKIRRRKRMRLFQAKIADSLQARAVPGQVEAAMKSALDFDPRLDHIGPNVTMRHTSLRGHAFSLMSDFVDRFRSKHGGLTRDIAGMDDVVRALHGEDATPEAKAFADAITEARNFLTGRHNAAGGDLQRRQDWGWVQTHDRSAVAAASKDTWVEFVLTRIDPQRMLDDAGEVMTARRLREAVESVYDSVLLGGDTNIPEAAAKFGSPVSKRIHSRFLVFRDAEAWLQYQTAYGAPDIFSSIIGEIDRLARDVATIEVLGPYPRMTLETMTGLIDADRARGLADLTGRETAKQSDSIGKHRGIENLFDVVTGRANIPADSGWARVSQSNRNLVTAARLGSAIFAALGDIGTLTATARYNGLSQARVLKRMLGQLNPSSGADRRMAARAGYIAETWAGAQVGAERLLGEVTGAPSTARIADTVLRMSGLNAFTDAGRSAFKLEFIGALTDHGNLGFDRLPDALRNALGRHGIDAADWDAYRATPLWTDPETGADFIRPEDVYLEAPAATGESARLFTVAQKFNGMIAAEANFAVVMPTARGRAIATGGTPPGTFWGEIVRNALLFRSFPITFIHLHGQRALAMRGLGNRSRYLAHIFIGMTMAGAVAEQMSSIARGRDPRDMTDPKFWASAVIRGGSLGPLGDFLYSGTSRHGASLPEGLLGPVLGSQLVAGTKLSLGNINELITEGEARNAFPELRRFADGLLPGRSLWYARLAMERLIFDEMEQAIDPDASRRFKRIEDAARREYDQRYWWRPGK